MNIKVGQFLYTVAKVLLLIMTHALLQSLYFKATPYNNNILYIIRRYQLMSLLNLVTGKEKKILSLLLREKGNVANTYFYDDEMILGLGKH